jgi:glutamyl-tRNA reductase
MRINPDESIESWATRVSMFEKGRAMQRIARGDDIEKVMEDMSRRITDKIIHPVLKAVNNSENFEFDIEQSRNIYNEKMKNVAKAADHIDSDT